MPWTSVTALTPNEDHATNSSAPDVNIAVATTATAVVNSLTSFANPSDLSLTQKTSDGWTVLHLALRFGNTIGMEEADRTVVRA